MKHYLLSLALVCLLLMPSVVVLAQEEPLTQEPVATGAQLETNLVDDAGEQVNSDSASSEAVLVATVNIHNPLILLQNGNTLTLSAEFFNREKAQPQIKYSIRLTKHNEEQGADYAIDDKVYDDVFSLSENETIVKVVEYQAPAYLNGEYKVWIISENESGLPLGQALFGGVTFEGDGQSLDIASQSCSVEVEEDGSTYSLMQGVDVTSEEHVTLHCDITNNFTETKEFTHQLEMFRRSVFGEKIEARYITKKMTLAPGETKLFSFPLPATLPSQAYSARLSLFDERGNTVSSKVYIHYVIRGLSGTIQNVTLNKNFYNTGDTALISFFWTGTADNFPGSRAGVHDVDEQVIVEGVISDYQNNTCSQAFSKHLAESGEVNQIIEVPITADCLNPTTSLTLKSENGEILDESVFTLTSNVQEEVPSTENQTDKSTSAIKYITQLLVILAVASVAFILLRKKKGVDTNHTDTTAVMLFILLLGTLFFMPTGEVKADTVAITHFTVTYNINKSTYTPNEAIISTALVYYSECINSTPQAYVKVTINGTTVSIVDDYIVKGPNIYGSASINAESTPGSYSASFRIRLCEYGNTYSNLCTETDSYIVTRTIPYTVAGAGAGAPSCAILWNPSTIPINNHVGLSVIIGNDADNTASCTSSGSLATVPSVTLSPGVSTEGLFTTTGTKTYTCTVTNASNVSTTCSGTLTVVPLPTKIDAVCAATHYNCTVGILGTTAEYSSEYKWWCNGLDEGYGTWCSEPKSVIIGSCGSRDTTYTSTVAVWPVASTLCGDGTPSADPDFPSVGSSASWDCLGSGGGADASCTAVHSAAAVPVPGLTFTASPASITGGVGDTTSTLTWTPSNVAECNASAIPASIDWTGPKDYLAGTYTQMVTPIGTTVYSLECKDGGGVSVVKTATVTVGTAAGDPTVTLVAKDFPYRVGNEIVWTATASGGSGSYSFAWGGEFSGSGEDINLIQNRVKKTFLTPGPVVVDVTVTDSLGKTGNVTLTITVENNVEPQ